MNNKKTYDEIRKDLRTIKNKWVFKDYIFNGEVYKTKRYNNWFQIFRNENTGANIVFPMLETQKAVLNHLFKYEKENIEK